MMTNTFIGKKLSEAVSLYKSEDYTLALDILNRCKSYKTSVECIDYIRALCFIKINQPSSAYQAVLEELRYFPHNKDAIELMKQLKPNTTCINEPEFRELFEAIQLYTMVGEKRLYSLFTYAKQICINNIPGNFVECGVAAGGTSALLCYVIKKYSKIHRKHYAFDSFEGMPAPGPEDIHGIIKADDTGWGTGTCAAPKKSVMEIVSKLGCSDILTPVQGYFCDTLPVTKEKIGTIALLHMDGDWYESTIDIFENLYDQVIDNGYIQVDDYGFWEGCSKAVHEWESQQNFKFDINVIDSTGVFFFKPPQNKIPKQIENHNQTSFAQSIPIASKGVYLNLGCGSRYHTDWKNIDFNSNSPNVSAFDLSLGIPGENNSAHVVYHSHLLEHFPKHKAPFFLKECLRVLKSGGILRIAVPDLEQIARSYLENIGRACENDKAAQERYDWTVIELLDQLVRTKPGGEMLQYWKRQPMPAKGFVIERVGSEAKSAIDSIQNQQSSPGTETDLDPTFEERVRFREQGELHLWMYDRYSLQKLLESIGFVQVKLCKADESDIPDFNSFLLDIEQEGKIRKPDSLFMEARK